MGSGGCGSRFSSRVEATSHDSCVIGVMEFKDKATCLSGAVVSDEMIGCQLSVVCMESGSGSAGHAVGVSAGGTAASVSFRFVFRVVLHCFTLLGVQGTSAGWAGFRPGGRAIGFSDF